MPVRRRRSSPPDDVPWSRKTRDVSAAARGAGVVRSSVAYAELHAHSAYSFLDGASTPEELVEEARTAGSACPRADRPQRPVRGRCDSPKPPRKLDVRTVIRRRAVAGDRRPAPSGRIRPARTCWCWPAAPEGYRRLSRQLAAAHLAGGEKGKLRYDFDALTGGGRRALAHPERGCRKRPCCARRFTTVGPDAAERAAGPIWWTGSAPAGSASS